MFNIIFCDKKNFKFLLLFLCFICLAVLSCEDNNSARIICRDLGKCQSRVGFLNTAAFSLGDVIRIDTLTKTFKKYYKVKEGYSKISTPVDTTIRLTYTDFEVILEGDISNRDVESKNRISDLISSNTIISLTNFYQVYLGGFCLMLQSEPEFLSALEKGHGPNILYMVVGRIFYADEYEFGIHEYFSNSTEGKTLRFEDNDIALRYECQDTVKINAKRAGAFFQPWIYRYDPETKGVKAVASSFKVSEYLSN